MIATIVAGGLKVFLLGLGGVGIVTLLLAGLMVWPVRA